MRRRQDRERIVCRTTPRPGISKDQCGTPKERNGVTNCPRCGQAVQPGSAACPRCGAQLASPSAFGSPAGNDNLPAWLRQLQSQAPQQPPSAQNSAFGPGQVSGFPGGAYSGQLGGGAPAANVAAGGFGAPAANMPGSGFGAPAQPFQPGGLSTSSMISEDALPEWLRSAGPPEREPAGGGTAAPAWGTGGFSSGLGAPAGGFAPSPAPAQPAPPAMQNGFGGGFAPQPAPGSNRLQSGGLLDDSVLPDWLRNAPTGVDIAAEQTIRQPIIGNQQPAMPGVTPAAAPGFGMPSENPRAGGDPMANAFPGIEQAAIQNQPPQMGGGLAGSALFDANALPSWLGGQQTAASAGASTGMQPGDGMSAQSLIDEHALPEWLRAQAPAAAPAAPSFGAPQPAIAQSLATSASAEPLPTWLNQVYSDAQVPRVPAAPAQQGIPAASQAPTAMPRVQAGLPASQFVDESALPSWLKAQGGLSMGEAAAPQVGAIPLGRPEEAPPTVLMPGRGQSLASAAEPAPSAGGLNFSASDLIDPSALPSWIQGEPAPQPNFSSTQGWTQGQPAVQMPSPSQQQQLPQSGALFPPAPDGLGHRSAQLDADMPQWGSEPQWGAHQHAVAPRMDAAMPSGRPPQDDHAWFQPSDDEAYQRPHGAAPARPMMPEGLAGDGLKRPLSSAELPPWLRGGEPVAPQAPAGYDQRYQQAQGWQNGGASARDGGWDGANYADPYADPYGAGQEDFGFDEPSGYSGELGYDNWSGGGSFGELEPRQERGWRKLFRRR